MQAMKQPVKKRVLVTGGALRLGAAICETFAGEGWEVVCHYRTGAKEAQALCQQLREQGLAISTIYADLGKPEDCESMMAAIARDFGRLDCLVNNASLFHPDTGLDFDPAQAAHQLQVNLLAPLMLAKMMANSAGHSAQAEHSGHAARGGRDVCVIHILDQKVFNLNPDYFSYTVSKLALERAVGLQAQALAPRVRVCGVAPGLMYLSGPQTPDNFAQAAQANLMRRPTDPMDVARTCLFLAGTPSITGTTVSVDNGQHLVPTPRDIMFVVDELLKKTTS
jgi:NAD(P)-dependent dehydrogenase (short-subunit alcohol dehydrogenase family)